MIEKCSFCGKEKSKNTKLVENGLGHCICNHCLSKAKSLISSEFYEEEKIIDINAELPNISA